MKGNGNRGQVILNQGNSQHFQAKDLFSAAAGNENFYIKRVVSYKI